MSQVNFRYFDDDVVLDTPSYADFPTTRYQGSKRKILPFLFESLRTITPGSALDLYSGTATVSLLLRTMGWRVHSNDYLSYNANTAKLFLTSMGHEFAKLQIHDIVERALTKSSDKKNEVSERYAGIFFLDEENEQIDDFCHNLQFFPKEHRQLLIYLMGQAMLMKRPYNLFHRANLSMRLSKVKRSFGNAKTWERSFSELMVKLGTKLGDAPFYGPVGTVSCANTLDLSNIRGDPDLIYLDPPYLNGKALPVDYSGFYGFLNGLVDYAEFATGDEKYPHKPIGKVQSAWSTPEGGLDEIGRIAERWPRASLVISYRGDGLPKPEAIISKLEALNFEVKQHLATRYKYALSKSFDTTERLIIAIRN